MQTNSEQPTGVPAPPVIYLPVDIDPDGQVSDIKMIRLGDGRVALLGYTALDRFIDVWGESQPWMLFDTRKVDEIQHAKPFDLKLLDAPVPEHVRSASAREVGA